MTSQNESEIPEDNEEICRCLATAEEVNRFLGKFILYMRPTSVEE